MADSNITKKALATALKELMEEMPFDKINVAQICDKCSMNRKSFYYHFKDKYDLVNWIFDMEFIQLFTQDIWEDHWKSIEILCELFYKNKNFYRRALKIKGQNSFTEHFQECMYPLLKKRLEYLLDADTPDQFVLDFFSDACISAFSRWLMEPDCMPPEQFSALLKSIIQSSAVMVYKEIETEKQTCDK